MKPNRPEAPAFAVAVAQSIAVPNDVDANVAGHVRLASLAAENGARMVIFPELSLTGYDLRLTKADALAPDDERLLPLREVARSGEIVVVAGAPIPSSDGLYIGAIVFIPDGEVRIHTKQYLHPGEEVAFIPGPGGDPLVLDEDIVGLAICADITHPEHACNAAERGATIYAAGCFLTEGGYAADTDFLQRYAIDHRMIVLMANYGAPTADYSCAGQSAIWSDTGELLARAPATGEGLCIAERREDGWVGRVVVCS